MNVFRRFRDRIGRAVQLRIEVVADKEIVRRGGEGSWAEASLREAITSGVTYSY